MLILRQFQIIITILGGECLRLCLWGMGPICLCCALWKFSGYMTVHRIGIYGYGYIHGYPRKNLWIWIWIWMGNFICTASLLLLLLPRLYETCKSNTQHHDHHRTAGLTWCKHSSASRPRYKVNVMHVVQCQKVSIQRSTERCVGWR